MAEPDADHYDSPAGQAAFFALRICLPWAEASRAAYGRWRDLTDHRPKPPDDDWAMRRLSEVMVGLVALERALLCARWVIANRPDAATRFSWPQWDAEEVDTVWAIIKARRDAVAHVETWAFELGMGGVVVSKDRILITGLPSLSVITWQMWAVELVSWSELLIREGFIRIDGPAKPPEKMDWSDWPDWVRIGPRAIKNAPQPW